MIISRMHNSLYTKWDLLRYKFLSLFMKKNESIKIDFTDELLRHSDYFNLRLKNLILMETFIKENDPDLWHLWLITKEND